MKNPKTKPLDFTGQGFQEKIINFEPDNRLDRINYSRCYHNCQLSVIRKVRDKRLTESLELIEQSGFAGDLALFILGEIATVGCGDE